MSPKDREAYGVARAQDLAFDAVHALWRRRQAAGMSQADLARALGRDEAWVSRNLNGPANWTIRTLGSLVAALDGELEIRVFGREDAVPAPGDAYDAYSAEPRSATATASSE